MKSHEKDVQRGEGLPMGKKMNGGPHDKVKGSKQNTTAREAAFIAHESSKMGKADPKGGSAPTSAKSRYGQTSSPITMDPTVLPKARGFNERSMAGNADPCGGYDE